jgi:CheY-like chemotaxis protein
MMRSVLFVDDEERVLEGLENLMFPYLDEWDMAFATSGSEALSLLRDGQVDVIVTDMRMPGMDGAELLHRVKELCPRTVRIVLSGHAELEAAMRAMPVAHQFLSKPCEAKKLIRVLTQACHLQDIIADQRLQASLGDIGQLPARPETYSELCRIFAGDEWSLARSLISAFSRTISALAPLKSKRLASSFCAWFTAFCTSMKSTLETMSKVGMEARVGKDPGVGERGDEATG